MYNLRVYYSLRNKCSRLHFPNLRWSDWFPRRGISYLISLVSYLHYLLLIFLCSRGFFWLLSLETQEENCRAPIPPCCFGARFVILVSHSDLLQRHGLIWRFVTTSAALENRPVVYFLFFIFFLLKESCSYGLYCIYILYADQSLCGFPSTLVEFFLISSEAWFFCSGVDLYITITNPFSSFKNRFKTNITHAYSM